MSLQPGQPVGSGAAPAARSRPSSLEYSQNVVTDEDGSKRYVVARCGCDCWYCKECCEVKGYNLRARLIPALQAFKGLMMLTLTVDPELLPSPQAAYLHVRKRRAISRLMQDLDRAGWLHSRRYFYVVEFQKDTLQTHFHVLIDATFVPKDAIEESWGKNRPRSAGPVLDNRPPFGIVRFSQRKFSGGPVHAGRYASKYLVKVPDYGWPPWVMSMGVIQRVPRYGTSRRFWGTSGRPRATTDPRASRAAGLPYKQRIAECGAASNVFVRVERVDHGTGEVTECSRWLGRVDLDLRDVPALGTALGIRNRRREVRAGGLRECVAALVEAAGRPVRFISLDMRAGGAS